MLEEKEIITVDETSDNSLTDRDRLDKYLFVLYPEYSRTYFQKLIEEGFVLLNGKAVKKRTKLLKGDTITLTFKKPEEISLNPENIPLKIIYEDPYLLAVNKDPGLVVHPAPGHPSGTLVNALLHHCPLEKEEESLRPGIVHRLDKDTSGLILVAKTLKAHIALANLFKNKEMEKTYVALCVGNPPSMVIEAPLFRHPTRRKEMAVSESAKAKAATTVCRYIASEGGISLVELDLLTGRTHQIRVHLQHKGYPILGDPVYGNPSFNKKWGATRQMLHAYRLCFMHPVLKKMITLEAPIPKDFQSILKNTSLLSQKYLLD